MYIYIYINQKFNRKYNKCHKYNYDDKDNKIMIVIFFFFFNIIKFFMKLKKYNYMYNCDFLIKLKVAMFSNLIIYKEDGIFFRTDRNLLIKLRKMMEHFKFKGYHKQKFV